MRIAFLFIWLLQMVQKLEAVAIDNGVIGEASVQCEREHIHFSVNTQKPFRGKVFVKGEYTNEQCVRNFARANSGSGHTKEETTDSMLLRTSRLGGKGQYETMIGAGDQSQCPPCPVCKNGARMIRQAETGAGIDIKLGTCNAKRDRTISPPGIVVSFTIVVSFHENFVTKVDRAYRIQCAYAEVDKTVTTQIDVSMPQSTELMAKIDSPKCEYRIKGESGDAIKNVRVGDTIEHEWWCAGGVVGMYSMLVNSCYAEGGDHQKELVIDEKGCSLDTFVIPTPEYDKSGMLAKARSLVFKFPDRTDIAFQCDILVCVRGEQYCDQLTPPKCDGIRQRRSPINASLSPAWRLHTKPLNVIDIDETLADDELAALNQQKSELSSTVSVLAPFCVSLTNFGIIIASSTFFLTITSSTAFFLCFFKDPLRK